MRFTILTQYYLPEVGAAQTRLLAFSRALQANGHQVQVVTAMPNYPSGVVQPEYQGKWWYQETIGAIPVYRTWIYPATGRNVLKRLANYFSFTISCLFALFIIPQSDVIFVESPPLFLCLSGWLISRLRRQKLCLNISDLWPDSVVAVGMMNDGLFVKAARILEHWLYQQADYVCGVTDGVNKGLLEKGVKPEKLLFLPNGADTELFQAIPYHKEADAPYEFVYAGTHGYAHGVEVILRTADILRHRSDIQFILVGDGADKPRLKAIAEELNLPNVVFSDPIPLTAMPALLNHAYAAIITVAVGDFFQGSRSAKIFPALAAGKPILHAGEIEGGEVVRKAQAGIITPAGDAQALADAVIYLIENPQIAQEMSQQGRKYVENEYSWTIIVQKWLLNIN